MNDEQSNADHLSDFVDRLNAGHGDAPDSPEAQTAADLHHMASRITPSANLMQRALPPLQTNGQLKRPQPTTQEDFPMTSITQRLPGQRPARRLAIPLTLAAAVAAVFLLLSVLLGQPNNQPVAAPIVIQASTETPTPAPTATATPTLSPSPTPTPAYLGARLPVPAGAFVGDLSTETLTRLRGTGMTWVAVEIPFAIESGTSNLALASMVISAIHEHNLRVALRIVGTPQDMLANRETYTETYAAFVGTVAALSPDAIQVWKEPNIDRNWLTGEISSMGYAELLAAAYDAIKAANPSVMVISAAPAPTGAQDAFPNQVMNDDAFYEGLARADAASHADCIGVQYNEGIVPPEATEGDPRDDYDTRYLPTMMERAAAPFRARGDAAVLCVTELGYLSPEGLPEPLPPYFEWANDTTVAEQAEWLAGALSLMNRLGSKQFRLVLVNNFNSVSPAAYDQGFSMMRPDGSCPACDAIAALRR